MVAKATDVTDFNRFASVFCGRGLKQGLRRGIERETLRVTPKGYLAETPHPQALGAPLTHSLITTDFGEAQPEMITRVHGNPKDCLAELRSIHSYVTRNIGEELLWPASMPCVLFDRDRIQVAEFGSTNEAKLKTVYRKGLANRYGPLMQIISGLHYNVSIANEIWEGLAQIEGTRNDQEFRNRRYLDLIRNFNRHSWLLIFLFGASPSLCESFVRFGNADYLEVWDDGTRYMPYATSLRMGPLGYQSSAQKSLYFSFNSIATYASQLSEAMRKPHPDFERLGLKSPSGEYLQLNTSVLQFEAEYYGTVRPKRTAKKGERPLTALLQRGIEYIELRCIDLNPFEVLGISLESMEFMDLFVLHCLVSESPRDSKEEIEEIHENQYRTVHRGREPDLTLLRMGTEIELREWALELLAEIKALASALDFYCGGGVEKTVDMHRQQILDPDLLPSARVLRTMKKEGVTFFRFAMNLAEAYREELLRESMDPSIVSKLDRMTDSSLQEWQRLETSPRPSFAEYLREFLGQGA